ncbi:MAG: response regulator receiver protein [Hyphomicrobiales bacterium]|jgi:CheY-like chemotaxis protein|nr:response regulator receiver protein [Hyphomicrobiales bacterium]
MAEANPLILVVEDEEIVREIVCLDLAEAGFAVLEAASGDEAIVLLRNRSAGEDAVDLLFTDIRMPGTLDGWTLAEQARDLAPGLGVIYASGHITRPERAVPGSIFLSKPYRTANLLESLRRLQGA